MPGFVLSKNYFEYFDKVHQKTLRTALGSKSAPPYTCTWLDEVKTEFLKMETSNPYCGLVH